MTSTQQHTWITGYIWGIADDVLRDLYVRGESRKHETEGLIQQIIKEGSG